jgi:hypothetical protein
VNGTSSTAVVPEIGAVPPIRTPQDYLAAIDAAFTALSVAAQATREGREDALALTDVAGAMSDAVKDSPFRMRGGKVIARGFLPRICS